MHMPAKPTSASSKALPLHLACLYGRRHCMIEWVGTVKDESHKTAMTRIYTVHYYNFSLIPKNLTADFLRST